MLFTALLRPPAPRPGGGRDGGGFQPRAGATTSPAIEALRPLVHAAGDLALDDREAWRRLCLRSWCVVPELIERGALPRRFELLPGDGPAIVAQVLAEAWWWATGPLDLRHHRG